MNRRDFIKKAMAGTTAAILAPSVLVEKFYAAETEPALSEQKKLPDRWGAYQWVYDRLLSEFPEVVYSETDLSGSLAFAVSNGLPLNKGLRRNAFYAFKMKRYPYDINAEEDKEAALSNIISSLKTGIDGGIMKMRLS